MKKQIEGRKNKMEIMPMPKLILNVSVPLMISMLVQSLYNIVDGIFVSRISENALTATSLAYAAQMLMLAAAVGTGVGINSLLSRSLGKGDFETVNKVAVNGIFLAAVSSIVFMVIGGIGAGVFVAAFTEDAEIIVLGEQYLRICMTGCCGIFLATTGERLLQATGNTFLSMVAQLTGAVTNIILDPVLIFGLPGLPAMGIRGAALATVIGQLSAAAAALILNKVKNSEIHFKWKGFRPDGIIIKEVYRVGLPTMLMQTMGSIMMVAMNALLIGFSSLYVAFFGIYYKLWTFLYMPVSGLAQGLIPIVGYNFGAGNTERVKKAFQLTLMADIGIMTTGTVVFLCIPAKLLGLYEAGEQMLFLGVRALRIMAIPFPLAAVTITIGFCCSGLGNGMVSMISTLLRQLLVLIPLAYLLAYAAGVSCVWYAVWVSETAAVVYAVWQFKFRVVNKNKEERKKRK